MRPYLRSFLLIYFLFSSLSLVFAQSPEAKKVAELVRQLGKIEATDDQPIIPEKALTPFAQLKRTIPGLVLTNLNTIRDPFSSKDRLRTAIQTDLQKAGITIVEDPYPMQEMTLFGLMPIHDKNQSPLFSLANIVEVPVPNHKDMIGVGSAIEISCGWDESFSLYKKENDQWKLILVQQGLQEDKKNGLQENLVWAFIDDPKAGGFFVAAAFNPPWPTSCWSSLIMNILKPDKDPFHPKVIQSTRSSFYRCDPFLLSSVRNIIKLNYVTSDWHKDTAGETMHYLDEYSITNGIAKKFKWTVSKETIQNSHVEIFYQEKSVEDQASAIRKKLEAKGFIVKTRLNPSWQEWPNTIKYFNNNDDELSKFISDLTYTMRLSEFNSSFDQEQKSIPAGSIEIWICDENENDKLKPKGNP